MVLVLVCWGMLKRVPVWGGEGWWWPGYGWCSCPVAGLVTLPDMSCRSGLQAAIGAELIGAGCASHRKNRHCPAQSQRQEASGSRLQEFRSR